MTEAEWLTSASPKAMLALLAGTSSPRKLRLFACACCRRVWRLLSDERSRRAVEANERFADHLAGEAELHMAQQDAVHAASEAWAATLAAREAAEQAPPTDVLTRIAHLREAEYDAKWAAAWLGEAEPERTAALTAWAAGWHTGRAKEQEEQCQADLVRDIFNPFHPLAGAGSSCPWPAGEVLGTALAIYHERRFAELPVLADLLQETGCDNADVLAHCRSGREHVRGCWVLDLLLGKQ